MPYIQFEDLKEILISYRSSRNNVISPYFAVEYDYFLRYFYDFKNLKFIIEKIDDGNISQLYERLTNKYEKKFSKYFEDIPILSYNNIIPEDIKDFIKEFEALYRENRERIEGYLIHDVFIERLIQLSTRQGFNFEELDSLYSSSASQGPIPDSVLRINNHKIAIEFKTRGYMDRWLLIKRYHSHKYKKYITRENIESVFVLHSIYPFDFDHLPEYYLGLHFLSPSTDSAVLIPIDLYIKIPLDLNSHLKGKRKQYLGVELDKARENDLLYNGWNELIKNLLDYLNGNLVLNQSDAYIKCRVCKDHHNYLKDCHPYTRQYRYYSYGYCFTCIQNSLGNLPIFLFEDVVKDMIDDEVDTMLEMDSYFLEF